MSRPTLPLRLALVAFLAGLTSLGFTVVVGAPTPDSPLAAYPGFGGDVAADEAMFDREELQRAELIAACMQAAGFDWQARPASRSALGDVMTGLDPNQLAHDLLGPEARRAWNVALVGAEDPNELGLDADGDGRLSLDESWGTGCLGDAHRAVPGIYARRAHLAPALHAMRQAIREDARVRKADRAWAECAHGHGLRGATRPLVHERIEADLGAGEVDVLDRLDAAAEQCDPAWHDVMQQVTVEYETDFVRGHADVLG